MKENKFNQSFWPSYVDIMTTLFAIMLILFVINFSRFKVKEKELRKLADKYTEIQSIYKAVENIDPMYFEFNKKYVKHIFKIQVTFNTYDFSLYKLKDDVTGHHERANALRNHLIDAGKEIQKTIINLQKNDSIKGDIKYLVVIEGQASKDGYNKDLYHNNYVLSYQRALALNEFWKKRGIDFSEMPRCELLISGSGEKGVPRNEQNEYSNQRFLIHIVPVIGNIRLEK